MKYEERVKVSKEYATSIIYSQDGCRRLLQKVGTSLPNYTATHRRRKLSSAGGRFVFPPEKNQLQKAQGNMTTKQRVQERMPYTLRQSVFHVPTVKYFNTLLQ
jgi:hypothetical protein